MISEKFIVPIYNATVRFIIGNSEETKNYLQEIFGEYKDFKTTPDCSGKVADLEDGSYLIWLPYTPTTFAEKGILAHEIFHLAVSILLGRDIPLNEDTEEAVAYLIAYLTEEILPLIGNDPEK